MLSNMSAVLNNRVQRLVVTDEKEVYPTHKDINIKAETIFDILPYNEDIEWKITPLGGLEGDVIVQHNYVNKNEIKISTNVEGIYWVSAKVLLKGLMLGKDSLSDIGNSVTIKVEKAHIEQWYFSDSKGNRRSTIGWWQPFWVRVSAPLLREQEATLHFWLDTQEKDKSHTARFKEICSKKVKFSPQGYLKEEIEKDFWEKIEKLPSYYECNGERRIFFTLSGIRSVIDNCNKEIYESSFKDINGQILIDAVRDVYMNIVSGVRLLGYFTQDKLVERLTHVVRYGEQVKMVLYVMYPQGYDINKRSKSFYFKLFENKKGEDIKLISREGLTPNEEGRIEVLLNTDYKGSNGGICQADHPNDTPYLPRLFYCKFYNKKEDWEQDKNERFTYPAAYGTAGGNDAYLDIQLDEKTTEQEAKEKVEALKSKRFNYFEQLKIAKDPVLDKSLSGAGVKIGVKPEEEKKEEEGHSCPRCTAPVTVAQLRELFPKAEEDTLKTVADTYTKYMKELQMDTCWNKAHFFAQAAIETGFKLDIKSGEGFNYYWEDLIEKFRAFQTTEGRKKAKEWGRAERNSKINGKTNPKYQSVSLENKKKIANWAYSPSSKTGKELGNIYDNDGWTFRGKGLIQLTGRSAYQYANTYTKKENADIIANPDLVMTNIAIGVISSMAFFKWKKINILANGNRNTKSICKEVGNDVDTTDPNGKPSKNHAEKIIFFNNSSSKVFKIEECLWGHSKGWHDPVDNPRRTKYNSGGNYKPVNGAYGKVRNGYTKFHSGLDLFALPYIKDEYEGTPVYACLDGVVVESTPGNSAGQTIRIRINNTKELLEQEKKVGYKLEFSKGEIMGIDIKETDKVFFIYMHLSKRLVKEDEYVKAGQIIGYSGVSGSIANGIPSPHLHLEIATVKNAYGTGENKRTNPARFIKLNSYDTKDQDEAVDYKYYQDGTKKKWNAPKNDHRKL